MESKIEEVNGRLSRIENLLNALLSSNKVPVKWKEPEDEIVKLVKIDAAVEITGYTKSYIYELTSKGKIPYIKLKKGIRFDPVELREWMLAGRPDVMKKAIKSITNK